MEQMGMDEEAAARYLNVSTVLFVDKIAKESEGGGGFSQNAQLSKGNFRVPRVLVTLRSGTGQG